MELSRFYHGTPGHSPARVNVTEDSATRNPTVTNAEIVGLDDARKTHKVRDLVQQATSDEIADATITIS